MLNSIAPEGLRGWFVTGTDTDVGKTCISAALLHWLGQQGVLAAGYKPVAAGAQPLPAHPQATPACEVALFNEDVDWLHRASTAPVTVQEVGPCVLQAPCAPHIAARLQGHHLRAAPLLQGAWHLSTKAQWLVVEGAGGFALPLCLPGTDPDFPQGFDGTDLAAHLGLPMVLVVGLRTGCLNHAVLTLQAIRAKGLTLSGWVANSLQTNWPYHADNIEALHALLTVKESVPCWGTVPRLTNPSPQDVAQYLDEGALRRCIFGP